MISEAKVCVACSLQQEKPHQTGSGLLPVFIRSTSQNSFYIFIYLKTYQKRNNILRHVKLYEIQACVHTVLLEYSYAHMFLNFLRLL